MTDDNSDLNLPKVPLGVYLVYNQMVHPIVNIVTRLGRSEQNDLVIQEDSISREHAAIRLENGEFVLYDLNSANGTFINHRGVEKQALKAGTLFYLADVAIVFVKGDKQVTDSLKKATGELKR
jgi:pSer/pThr/pTyr-binding forkhead associated (FHA) protein